MDNKSKHKIDLKCPGKQMSSPFVDFLSCTDHMKWSENRKHTLPFYYISSVRLKEH